MNDTESVLCRIEKLRLLVRWEEQFYRLIYMSDVYEFDFVGILLHSFAIFCGQNYLFRA